MTPITAILSALWLGVLTAGSPCTIATNVAAISLIGSNRAGKRRSLLIGLLYTAGRSTAYIALGALITTGLTVSDGVARFLQSYMNEALGPILIVLGLILLGWLAPPISLNLASSKLQQKATTRGVTLAMPIGMLFALSFCPISAALFFGGLIPLALKQGSVLLLPACFGIGTALPVIAFACIITFASDQLTRLFDRFRGIERWVRGATATIFILVGIRYTLCHIYALS
jgi:cytochrome c-type biogenesis protein